MALPVLIAARNEAPHIEATLSALPRNVEPIIIPNGCSDTTVDIAERYGVTILPAAAEGKLPALQQALRYLGNRATDPLIMLDADTKPARGRAWPIAMMRARNRLDTAGPACVVGPTVFGCSEVGLLTAVCLNATYWQKQARTRNSNQAGYFSGRNMLVDLYDSTVVDEIMELPNLWPGVDAAFKDVILGARGNSIKSLDSAAITFTKADRFPDLGLYLRGGQGAIRAWRFASYEADAPPGSIPYRQYQTEQNDRARAATLPIS